MLTVLAYFTNNGVPATGLSATVRIRKVSDNSLFVTDQAMTEVGDGWYKYAYSGAVATETYASRCYGGASLPEAERYAFGANAAPVPPTVAGGFV